MCPQTHCSRKEKRKSFKSDISFVSNSSIIMVQWCEMMDWLSSASDMCCHPRIERKQPECCAATEDSVTIHDTPADGEVCAQTDGKSHQTCCMWLSVRTDCAPHVSVRCFSFWHTWKKRKLLFFFDPVVCCRLQITSEDLFTNDSLWVAPSVKAYWSQKSKAS